MTLASLALWFPRVARIIGALVALCGSIVLIGWAVDSHPLTSIHVGWPRMSPSTALCFVVCGLVLWLSPPAQVDSRPTLLAKLLPRFAACLIALLGTLKLLEYALNTHVGFDSLYFFHEPDNTPLPAQMSQVTATNFVLLGVVLFLQRPAKLPGLTLAFTLLVGLLGWLGLSHYVFGGEPLFPLANMAAATAILFLAFSAGLVCLRTSDGLAALLLSDSPGGFMARILVPATLILPILFGWLRIKGQAAGLYGTEAGVSLLTLCHITVFGGLIWASAAMLHRGDAERKRVELKAQSQLGSLNLLNQITSAIGERQDLPSIYQVVVRSLEDDLPVDFCCICSHDPTSRTLKVVRVGAKSQPLAMDLIMTHHSVIPIDPNGLSHCVAGHLVYEPDVNQVPFPFPKRLAGGGLRSLVVAPLMVDSTVFGVLVAARLRPDAFASSECEFIKQLTEHVAIASHQSQLHTKLQEAYDDLRQTQQAVMQQERLRALGQMASGIAHDINNAITPVSLCAEHLLEHEKNLSPRGREYLEIIGNSTADVAHTVGRMREFYRQREPELTLTSVDLSLLAEQVIELTRARWSDMPQQRGIVIAMKTQFQADLPDVLGVESEIREALINLVFNAVDAMPEGGTLTLRTREQTAPPGSSIPRHAVLEVIDTGTGMDEDTRRRCLEPFFTTKGERGTGLGLAMVYGIVKRHNADIEIESAPGMGTTIRLLFAVPASPIAGKAGPQALPAIPTRQRILIVDDDPILTRVLRESLETDGHVIATAGGGQAGIDAFNAALRKNEPFGVVITDLGMPHVDGRKVAADIKAASPSTPIILLTGWGQRLVAEGDIPPHVDRVMSKPPKVHELRAALADLSTPHAT